MSWVKFTHSRWHPEMWSRESPSSTMTTIVKRRRKSTTHSRGEDSGLSLTSIDLSPRKRGRDWSIWSRSSTWASRRPRCVCNSIIQRPRAYSESTGIRARSSLSRMSSSMIIKRSTKRRQPRWLPSTCPSPKALEIGKLSYSMHLRLAIFHFVDPPSTKSLIQNRLRWSS